MHILLGAVVGAAFAVVLVGGLALATRKRPSAKSLLLAALGGAIAGAVTTATLGTTSIVGVSLSRQVVAFGAGGAVGGASERAVENVADGRPIHDGVVKATAIGAGAGVVSLGTLRGGRAVLGRVAPGVVSGSGGTTLTSRLLAAPAPGTGAGVVRTLEDRADEAEGEPERADSEQVDPERSSGLAGRLGGL